MSLSLRDHVRLEFERRRHLADASGLDLGAGRRSVELAREARRRAIRAHVRAMADGPRGDLLAAAVAAWLAAEGFDAAALDRLIALLEDNERVV